MKRNNYIDFVRGIAVFLMIWGHCIQYLINDPNFWDNQVFKTIYTFHMPLFMLISGYVGYWSIKGDFKHYLINKIKSLMVPMISYAIIIALFVCIKDNNLNLVNFLVNVKANWCGLWFLWSCLLISIIVGFIQFYIHNKYLKILFYVFGVIIIALAPLTSNNLFMYPFFIIGFLSNKYKLTNKEYCKYIEIISIIIWIIMTCFFKKYHYI